MDFTQPNHHNLSSAERLYYGSTADQPAMTIVKQQAPEPVKVVYRRAGRKKLTAAQIIERDMKETARKEKRNEERAEDKRLKIEAKLFAEKQRKERSAGILKQLNLLESRQASYNRAEPVPVAAPQPAAPSGKTLPVTNTPVVNGFINVRVDHKTVIQVREGRSIEKAIANYHNRRLDL